MVPVKIDSMSAFTALTQDLHVEGPLLLKLNRGFAPAAKVCFPPLVPNAALLFEVGSGLKTVIRCESYQGPICGVQRF